MTNVLNIVWSLPFLIGMAVGIAGQRLYCRMRARHDDRVHPLPDGKKRDPGGINRMWIGGLIAAACVLYVLSQAQQTHDDTVRLSETTRQCQNDLIASIQRGREIQAENDDLSVRQRDLFADLEELQGVWLTRLVQPDNPEIAALDQNDPRRQHWAIDVTIVYNERAAKLRKEVRDITVRQAELAEQRTKNPLPSPRCGQ
ncbi:membrane protein [Mycobacterium phage Indlovu]|nr:membrane protein [Mycobacterium phage Indlovu]